MEQCIVVDTHASRLSKMRQRVLTSCRLLETDTKGSGRGWYAAFLTLTFRESEDYRPDAMTDFLRLVRQWFSLRGVRFRYTWAAELTKRGRLHYHAVLWLPSGLTLPKPDKRGWWPYGMSRIERARHAGAYIAKYVSKGGGESSAYPKGARIHGAGGFSASAAVERRWWCCPSWVREVMPIDLEPRRAVGGGFLSRISGEFLPSPYRVVGIAGGFVRLVKVTE